MCLHRVLANKSTLPNMNIHGSVLAYTASGIPHTLGMPDFRIVLLAVLRPLHIEFLFRKLLLDINQNLTKPLEVHNLPFPQEP